MACHQVKVLAKHDSVGIPVKAECVSMCGDNPTPGGYSLTVHWFTCWQQVELKEQMVTKESTMG